MESTTELGDETVLVRRLPPDPSTVVQVPDLGPRASSRAVKPRKGEAGSSWSAFPPTTPENLLDLLRSDGRSPESWNFCWLCVGEARGLGLQVVRSPTDQDAGHCEIQVPESMSKCQQERRWKLLAERTLGRVGDYSMARAITAHDDLPGWGAIAS